MGEIEKRNGSCSMKRCKRRRNKDGEEWADIRNLLATWGHGETAIKDHVGVPGLMVARVCVDVHDSCCRGDMMIPVGCLLVLCLDTRYMLPL